MKDLEKQINKIDNPFDKRLYINSNKVDIKELKEINFKNIEYVITPNLPDHIMSCIVNKKEFDNFS